MADRRLDGLMARIAGLGHGGRFGRVIHVSQNSVTIAGLSDQARLGDRLEIRSGTGPALMAEVQSMGLDGIIAMPDGSLTGIAPGDRVRLLGPQTIAPDESWVGRILDADGRPLDGRPLMPGNVSRRFASPPPPARGRKPLGDRLRAGVPVFNTFLPFVRGQRIGLFAGSGVGKSTLLGQLARELEADIVVVALIGERGRELREFVDRVLGTEGMAKSIVVAATSDQPALSRKRCALSAMTIAEHFRDLGKNVLLLADSVTRFAEAHRDIALATGEPAGPGGFPPSMSQTIMELCERAGPGTAGKGDITAVFSVLVAGSDMEGPVADTLRGVLDGHIVLDRSIAEGGRFPAVDLLRSVSRSLPEAATVEENGLLMRARRIFAIYEKAELMIQAGLYTSGTDAEIDEAIRLRPALEAFLGTVEPQSISESYDRLAACLGQDRTTSDQE